MSEVKGTGAGSNGADSRLFEGETIGGVTPGRRLLPPPGRRRRRLGPRLDVSVDKGEVSGPGR